MSAAGLLAGVRIVDLTHHLGGRSPRCTSPNSARTW
jgi:hypothetical protein